MVLLMVYMGDYNQVGFWQRPIAMEIQNQDPMGSILYVEMRFWEFIFIPGVSSMH